MQTSYSVNRQISIIIWLILILSGCDKSELFLVNSMAKFGDYVGHTNIHYGNHAEQSLDIYLPDSIDDKNFTQYATVIFFYGGCWGACSNLVKNDYLFVAETLTANNIIAVVVDYRKFPAYLFPDIMLDAKHAVEWVSKNIENYGGNKNNLFLMGHSAGAHIASLLTFNENYLTVSAYNNIKGFIGLAGPYDFLPFTESYQPKLFGPPENYALSQTTNFVDGSEPPSLLLYGNDDTRVKSRNIKSLTKIIKEKYGKVDARYYDKVDHTELLSALSIPFRGTQPILTDIVQFISSQIR